MAAVPATAAPVIERRDDYGPCLLGDTVRTELRNVWALRRQHDRVERRRSARFLVVQGDQPDG